MHGSPFFCSEAEHQRASRPAGVITTTTRRELELVDPDGHSYAERTRFVATGMGNALFRRTRTAACTMRCPATHAGLSMISSQKNEHSREKSTGDTERESYNEAFPTTGATISTSNSPCATSTERFANRDGARIDMSSCSERSLVSGLVNLQSPTPDARKNKTKPNY